ncbi:MAG: acyltransferase, partial [Microbacterium sp.]|nr:acyltransferase [Microbacterium sp.]
MALLTDKDASARTDSGRTPREPRAVRADIQALRALAVGLVVLYHFWPKRLTGGYVGVDVFFVISGFLITSHLISKPPRNLLDLGNFWGRRVRRLLPASFLVLLVTLGASLIWAPATMWSNIAKQVAASAMYVENWFLAAESVDYLAADNAATPVQHFWSLSVEEQFYIVWPLLIALALLMAARAGWKGKRRVMTLAVGTVVVLSLGVSIVLTATDPAAAYFVSWTRFWELGVGGVIAGVFPLIQRWLDRAPVARPVLALAGLIAVVISAVAYVPATPFPGVAAMLPVLGTAAVIAAAVDERRWAVTRPIG